MKKLFKVVAVAVLSLGFGVAAQAQSSTQSISANAVVLDQIKVNAEQSMDFGQVMGGSSKTISVSNAATSTANGDGLIGNVAEKAGVFSLLASKGTSVTLTFDLPTALNGDVPGNTLPISFSDVQAAVGISSTMNYQAQTPFDPNSAHTITSFPENILSYGTDANAGSGNGVFIYLGATIDATSAKSDSYSNTITLTATYN